jgi:hypothetical protein
MEPYVSRAIQIVKTRSDFKVIAREPIPSQTVVEICSTYQITNKLAILMSKTNPIFEKKLIIDKAEVDKEYQIFAELGEMELTRRLDAGIISPDEYSKILASRVNFNSLLEAKTHVIPLGNGLLYSISDYPNIVREFNSETKLCLFRTVQYIQEGTELSYFS